MASVDVLGPRMVLGVVREVDSRFVVQVQGGGVTAGFAELVEEGTKVGGFLSRFGGRDYLRFARGERHRRLLFAAPRDGSLSIHEDMT
eukprot:4480169-Pleurochrysis_carterae.AAC.1